MAYEIEYIDVHGVKRRVEVRPCSCDGYGCENCGDPADYVPTGYVPAWD